MTTRRCRAVLIVAALAAGAADSAAAQQAASPFPAGKPVSIHVGTTPGAGNDNVMRLIARHIGKYLPGNPNIVARNTPGAGGRRLAGLIANTAPRDGSEFAQLHRGLVIEQLLGDTPLPFRLQDFTWLGSPTSTTDTCIVWHTARVQSVEDLHDARAGGRRLRQRGAAAPPAATPHRRQSPQRDRLSRRRADESRDGARRSRRPLLL